MQVDYGMTPLHKIPIPIHVESRVKKVTNRSIATAVLSQILASLNDLVQTGKTAIIDLRSQAQMSAATYNYLKEALSAGEVTAVIEADLKVEITETQYPGVWWLTHRNDQGAIVTELIEITEMPDILRPNRAEIRAGLRRLEQALQEPPPPAKPRSIGVAR